MAAITNTTVGHYEIMAPLGAGGMGEVYAAKDTRLERLVALKVLPTAFTQEADRVRRFMQEAKAASALNHPNIITVYDIGECEAGRFIVMEFVAGRTLRNVIKEDNSLATLLTLGQQMAKALIAAHTAGITHRDIKPDNIMVRDDGYVKVLDFGLARLSPLRNADFGMRREEDADTLLQPLPANPQSAISNPQCTLPGTVMGTVAYMSPEQARGETVSPPSDVFALGIVLYELATGRHPFQAETLVGYLHAITLQEPQPLTQWKPELPAALNMLILRMLNKDASQRPSASEVAQALQDIERRGVTASPPAAETETMMLPAAQISAPRVDEGFWVAVLPFKWRGANAELEALAEGLSEDIVTGLSRFSYLRVIARSSTLRFTSETSDARAIGKEVGARYVMEGSLRQAGSQLRVAVQLVDATTGAHLWAEAYDRQFRAEDIFALQDELTPQIVSTVADQYGALVHSMTESLRGRNAASYSAHEAVLRAFGYLERISPEEHAEVRSILEAAVAATPGHSNCHAMLSLMYWHEYANGYNAKPDPLGRAYAAAQQAIAAAPNNQLAHYALANVLFYQKDFPAFRPVAERALALNQTDASTTALIGTLIAYAGDWEYGLEVVGQARRLNPHHPGWYHLAPFYDAYRRRNYRSALDSLLKVNMPGYHSTYALLAATYAQLGEAERAHAALRELQAHAPKFGAYARSGFSRWFDAELTEHLSEGLRKAGLAIPAEGRQALVSREDGEQERRANEQTLLHSEPSSPSVPSTPVHHTVGRTPERTELHAAFNAANDGRGSLLCVAGEPGIGKTTLVEDFLTELAAKNPCTIARGRCSERLAGTEAYLPLLEALESLLQRDKSLAATMKQLAPTWYAQVMPLAGDSEASLRLLAEVQATSQERMKRELAAFLTAVATPQPLVLFFDDLHWADVSTIDLLSFLAGKFDALRVLIVTTYRPSDMLLAKHPFLQIKPDLQARGLCRELSLEFLTEAEIADYLTLEFPRHAFPPDFARLIHAKTEGSPLFMADLVRYLRDRGVIAQTTGSWKLEQTLPDIERELPESVRGMIERKIAQLSEDDRKLLTCASVQGYEFDSAVVAQVLKLAPDEVEERLEKLERVFAFVKLLSEGEFPNGTLTLKYRFVHILYQHVFQASLRVTRRVSWCTALGDALVEFYLQKPEPIASVLANLREMARDWRQAAECFLLAARHAARMYADTETAALAQRGLVNLNQLPPSTERSRLELRLQTTLGAALMTSHSYASGRVKEVYLRAEELCRELVDQRQLFRVQFGLSIICAVRGEFARARSLAAECLHMAEQTGDEELLAQAHWACGLSLQYPGDYAACRAHLQAAVALGEATRDAADISAQKQIAAVFSQGHLAVIQLYMGWPEQAEALKQVMLVRQQTFTHPLSLADNLYQAAFLAVFHRRIAEVRACGENVLQYAATQGLKWYGGIGQMLCGWAAVQAGSAEEGLAQLREGLRAYRATETELSLTFYFALLADAYHATGQHELGLAALTEGRAIAERTGERYFAAELYRLEGELLLQEAAMTASAPAEACFAQAIQLSRQQAAKALELRATMSLARLWQRQGKSAEARQMLAEIYGWFTEGFDTADLQDAKALLEDLQIQPIL